MSTTNLKLENIFPSYELVDTVATKASIADAIEPAGAVDDDSFTLNGLTITLVGSITTPGANEAQVLRASADGTNRDRIRNAINGVDASNTNISYGSGFTAAEGVDGVNASNGTGTTISLEAESVGATSLTLTNVTNTPVTAAGLAGSTGTAATGAIKIPVSELSFSENALTVAEAQDDTGDYRKFLYHVIRKYQEYIDSYEKLDNTAGVGGSGITIGTAGTGYVAGEALVFSGGNPTTAAAGTINVDGVGAITGFSITNYGAGYASVPTVTISTAAGVSGVLTANLTDNVPAKLAITKGSLVENTSDGTISRAYTSTFSFSESGLELATD